MANPAWSLSSIPLAVAIIVCIFSTQLVGSIAADDRKLNQVEEQLVLASLRDAAGKHLCSAVPISPDAVLTGARCFDSLDKTATYQVHLKKLGNQGWDHASVEIIPSERIALHPSYDPATSDNDVAVVFLSWKTSLLTYPLEASDDCFESGEGCSARLLDWGDDSSVVHLKGVSRERCRSLLPFTITENMLCAENLQPAICASDPGAPLLMGGKVVGIASTSFGCGREGNPEVYTSIPAVKWWIEEELAGRWRHQKDERPPPPRDNVALVAEVINSPSTGTELPPPLSAPAPQSQPSPSPLPPPPPPKPQPQPQPSPSSKQSSFSQASPEQITNALRNAIFNADIEGAANILSGSADVDALAGGLRFTGRRRLFGF
ncbi:hypothetical protein BSKO_04385 [Bryopsis sp. KO-2023]|nr:hypothetical protein BSKO_04385 [Bryopsis sp. KO-2023]